MAGPFGRTGDCGLDPIGLHIYVQHDPVQGGFDGRRMVEGGEMIGLLVGQVRADPSTRYPIRTLQSVTRVPFFVVVRILVSKP